MKIDKSRAPAKCWVKKALCAGAILGLAASMGTQTALANDEFEMFTPFSRIAKLPVVKVEGKTDYVATYERVQKAALSLARYVALNKESGESGDWVLGGTSKACRKSPNPVSVCTDDEIAHSILGIPSPEKIDPEPMEGTTTPPPTVTMPGGKVIKNVKKASVLDFCNEHYAKQALGVAPIINGKKLVNGYSHTPALPCEVSIWNDGWHIYVDMLDPSAIFTLFFTDVHFSDDMMTDEDFAEAIRALPPAVKAEIKGIVHAAMLEFAADEGFALDPTEDLIDVAIGPLYTSMDQVVDAVAASPEKSPYKHVGYTRRDGGVFSTGGMGTDTWNITQAIINMMSIHGEPDAGTHDTVINEKKGKTLESILSAGSSWRSARPSPLTLPGFNHVIEACSPKYAKMAMGTGLHHVTALPCEITVQAIDMDADGLKETLVVSYLDPHFMLGALFADVTPDEKLAFAEIPGIIMEDLQEIVEAALDDANSDYDLSRGFDINYDMLPPGQD
jgi:uncharacterized protein (DUF302 family)